MTQEQLAFIENRRCDVTPNKRGSWSVFNFQRHIYGEADTLGEAIDAAINSEQEWSKLQAEKAEEQAALEALLAENPRLHS